MWFLLHFFLVWFGGALIWLEVLSGLPDYSYTALTVPIKKASASSSHRNTTKPLTNTFPSSQKRNIPVFFEQTRPVILLDDLGLKRSDFKLVDFLPQHIIFSILPYARYASELAQYACERGRIVFIHLPAEPLDREKFPGPTPLRSGLSDKEVEAIVKQAKQRIPCAVGLNQHMGSRATQDYALMKKLVQSAYKNGIRFFVDSKTHPRTKLCEAVWARHGQCWERNLFLDAGQPTFSGILSRWNSLVVPFYLKRKSYVIITHPYPQTLTFLLHLNPQWLQMSDRKLFVYRYETNLFPHIQAGFLIPH